MMEEVATIKAEREVIETEIKDVTFDMCKYIKLKTSMIIMVRHLRFVPITAALSKKEQLVLFFAICHFIRL